MSATLFDLRKLSDEYHELRSCRAVAEKYGCNSETIRRVLIANEIPRNGWKVEKKDSKPRRVMPTDEEIAEAVKEHGTQTAAADALGISPTKVNKTMRKIQPADSWKRTCQYCGAEFAGRTAGAVFCSKRCKDNASKERRGIAHCVEREKVCPTCGGSFKTVYSRQIYCCQDCRIERKAGPKTPAPVFAKVCPQCGETFETDVKQKTYCSKGCCSKASKYRTKGKPKTEGRVCVVCGGEFAAYKGSMDKTCGPECGKVLARTHQRDKRIPKDRIIDRDITLKTLFKRDGGVCYICGTPCDYNDFELVDGNFIAGGNYPSIEHTTPIARGGFHSWENVRLAHRRCNTKKGIGIAGNPLTKEEARRYARERCSNKKETVQILDGVEIARYESTAQAARETGFNEKGIQNACRGESGTKSRPHRAYGYEWKYTGGRGTLSPA